MSKTITFDEWVKQYTGKKIDYDGAYGVQCVDLAKHYIKNVLGVEPQAIGNAKEYWNKRKTSQYLKDNFDFITPKYKDSDIQKGDIGVDTETASGYGHIFIIDHCKNGELYYYDTNGDGKGAGLTLRHKPYNATRINGILRPKNQKNIKTEPVKKPTATTFTAYKVKVTANALNVRASGSIEAKINTVIHKNEVYTIVDKKGDWGKLKSGAGWINLKYTSKV